MTHCYFAGYELPLWFNYQIIEQPRISIVKTINSDVVQYKEYYEGDTEISFSCKYLCKYNNRTLADIFRNAFKNVEEKTFEDYDSNSYQVIITEYTEIEERGYVSITGRFKVVV